MSRTTEWVITEMNNTETKPITKPEVTPTHPDKKKWIDDDDCENIIPEFESYEYDKKNPGVEIKLIKNGNKTEKKSSSSSD